MNTTLDIHNLSLEQIDSIIQHTWEILSDEDKKSFQTELSQVDNEYTQEIQKLIDTKLV